MNLINNYQVTDSMLNLHKSLRKQIHCHWRIKSLGFLKGGQETQTATYNIRL